MVVVGMEAAGTSQREATIWRAIMLGMTHTANESRKRRELLALQRRSTPRAYSLKDNHRDLAGRLLLVRSEKRHQGCLRVEQALTLFPFGNRCSHPKLLRSYFNDCLRIGEEIMIPIGMGW